MVPATALAAVHNSRFPMWAKSQLETASAGCAQLHRSIRDAAGISRTDWPRSGERNVFPSSHLPPFGPGLFRRSVLARYQKVAEERKSTSALVSSDGFRLANDISHPHATRVVHT